MNTSVNTLMREGLLSNHRVSRAIVLSLVLATGALTAGARPAAAAGSYDFLFSMSNVHNDNQYFLNLAVSNYGYQPAVLQPVLPRVRYVEADLPVLMFLQQTSGWPLPQLVDLRASGASWSVIFTRVGVPQDVLFAGMPENPGPPYGNAWGYWRQHPRGVRLDDHDVCDLVKIQMASRWVGAPAYEVARGYSRGVSAPAFVAERKGRPWQQGGHGQDGRGHGGNGQGQGQGEDEQGDQHHGNGSHKGQQHGHGKPNHH
jgi:hypothetical protein